MAKFKAFWNYQKKKTGEIVIAEEELQQMLDAAWGAGYNQLLLHVLFLKISLRIFLRFRPLQAQIHIHPISEDLIRVPMELDIQADMFQHMFFVRKKIRFSDIGKVTTGSKRELYLEENGLLKLGDLWKILDC